MIEFIRDKKKLTTAILNELCDDTDDRLEKCMVRWWFNIRENGGLRLSQEGDAAFRMAGIESWDIACPDRESMMMFNSPGGALDLDHYLNCPYYLFIQKPIKSFNIRLYDGRIASMVILHGSLKKYIELEKNRNK